MKSVSLAIEELLHAKIMLYRDLIDLLKDEKARIIEGDVSALWHISDKKQEIASEIVECRQMILNELSEDGIVHNMQPNTLHLSRVLDLLPQRDTGRLSNMHMALINLKDEIQALIRGNLKYIQDYLMIFDDLLGLITGSPDSAAGYDNHCYCSPKPSLNMLIHKEV